MDLVAVEREVELALALDVVDHGAVVAVDRVERSGSRLRQQPLARRSSRSAEQPVAAVLVALSNAEVIRYLPAIVPFR